VSIWSLLIPILLLLGALVLLRSALIIIPSGELHVVERLGRFDRVLRPGMYFLIPGIDRVARDFSTEEEPVNLPEHDCISSEGSTVRVHGILRYTVVDAKRAAYGVSDPAFGLLQAAQGRLRSIVERRSKRELEQDFDLVELALAEQLREASRDWGLSIGQVTLELNEAFVREA